MNRERVVEVERELNARPAAIWKALTTRDGIRAWFADDLEGTVTAGSRIGYVWRDMGLTAQVDVVATDEPRRLTLSQPRPGGQPDSVDITIYPHGPATRVHVTQRGFAIPDAENHAEAAASGWRLALRVLEEALERRAGQERASLMRTRATGLAVTQAVPFLLTRGGRALWLPEESQGEPIFLSSREAIVPLPSLGGFLEAKAYPGAPRQTILGLRAHSWSKPRAELEKRVPEMDAALERLEKVAAGKR